MTNHRKLGESHGTALYYDCSKPDADAFLAHMEKRMTEDEYADYLDGFMSGQLGECRRRYVEMRGFSKEGSEVGG